jgi:hypothetical protein
LFALAAGGGMFGRLKEKHFQRLVFKSAEDVAYNSVDIGYKDEK